jgi:HTH-type transcriptional regulator/antitoxin HigA
MNKIKAIKSDQDYKEALALLETLIIKDPAPGSEESDQLSILSTLIESYETAHFPTDLPDAIAAIKFRMEQQNLRPVDLVPFIGSASRVSEVLSGKRSLTVDMIRALEDGLGIPAQVLLKKPVLGEQTVFEKWDKKLYKIMQGRDYFTGNHGDDDQASILERFFASTSQPLQLNALLRQSSYRSSPTTDPYALVAWSRKVLNEAEKIKVPKKYVPGSVDISFLQDLAKLSTEDDGPIKASEYLLAHGIVMIVEPPLPKTRLDGAAMLNDGETPIIGLTLRMDRLDNFWFTLMHELAHVSLHYDAHEIEFFYDELDTVKGMEIDEREKRADELAGEALVPSSKWEVSPARIIPSALAASSLANELGVHIAIVAGKMRYEGNKWTSLNKVVGNARVREHFPELTWEK